MNVPQNLPEIAGIGPAANDEDEAKWEKRATMLVEGNTVLKTPGSPPTKVGSRSKNPNEISAPDDVRVDICTVGDMTGLLDHRRIYKRLFAYTKLAVREH